MAVFFMMVGLEIKELSTGQLPWGQRCRDGCAAMSPAAIYVWFNAGSDETLLAGQFLPPRIPALGVLAPGWAVAYLPR
jgi:NhaA family Na+:H+ antiporter